MMPYNPMITATTTAAMMAKSIVRYAGMSGISGDSGYAGSWLIVS